MNGRNSPQTIRGESRTRWGMWEIIGVLIVAGLLAILLFTPDSLSSLIDLTSRKSSRLSLIFLQAKSDRNYCQCHRRKNPGTARIYRRAYPDFRTGYEMV